MTEAQKRQGHREDGLELCKQSNVTFNGVFQKIHQELHAATPPNHWNDFLVHLGKDASIMKCHACSELRRRMLQSSAPSEAGAAVVPADEDDVAEVPVPADKDDVAEVPEAEAVMVPAKPDGAGLHSEKGAAHPRVASQRMLRRSTTHCSTGWNTIARACIAILGKPSSIARYAMLTSTSTASSCPDSPMSSVTKQQRSTRQG